MVTPHPSLLTYAQVADELQVSVATVRRLVALGKLMHVRISHVIRRVPRIELTRFVEKRTR